MRHFIYIATLLAGAAQAGTGDFDPTFSTDGKAVAGFDLAGGNFSDRALAVLPLPGGALMAVGQVEPFANGHAKVGFARFLGNGSLDPAFGSNGAGTVVQETVFESIADAGIDAQGRLFVAGEFRDPSGGDLEFGVMRFSSAGQPEIGYGFFGVALAAFDRGGSNEDMLRAINVAPDGTVLAVGRVKIGAGADYDFGLARWDANGAADNSFSGDGLMTIAFDLDGTANLDDATAVSDFNPNTMRVAGIARRADNSTVVAVASFLTSSGAPTPLFCSGTTCQGSQGSLVAGPGKRTLRFDPNTASTDYVTGVAIRTGTSGAIAVSGNTALLTTPFSVRGAVAVMSESGLLPAIPGPAPGRVLLDLGSPTVTTAIVHRFSDSHWIVTGSTGASPSMLGYVAYIDETPALDSSFTRIGLGGPPLPSAYQLVQYDRTDETQPVETFLSDVAIDSAQRIVGVGDRLWRRAPNVEDDDFAVFRLDESDVIFKDGFEGN